MTNLINISNQSIFPSRSRYQIRHFVIGQHDTPEMQYRQILLETQDLAYKIRMAELDIEKKRIEIHRLLSSGDPIETITAEEKQLGIILTERTLNGAKLELGYLQELANEVESYTIEEIENNQEEYWNKRLSRQAGLEQMGNTQGISVGNLNSMLQIGMLQKDMGGENNAVRYLETKMG